MELIDFQTQFSCVAPLERKSKLEKEIVKNAFSPIRNRVKFYSYVEVESDYKISLQKYDIV